MESLAWPAAVTPRLRLAGQFPLADRGFQATYLGPAHALHLHDYRARMRLGDAALDLMPGDLTLSPAGVATAYDLPSPGRHWCVHFFPDAGDGPSVALPLRLRLGPTAAFVAERMSVISRLHARGAGDLLSAARAAVALQELLLWCVGRQRDEADTLADRVAGLVEARFAEPLTADRIAREVGRSQNYVAARFRARFGMTIPRYVLQRRMAHARYLLEATDQPISAIAKRVGCPDPHYFNKLVRKFLGGSPTQVRAQARRP